MIYFSDNVKPTDNIVFRHNDFVVKLEDSKYHWLDTTCINGSYHEGYETLEKAKNHAMIYISAGDLY